jgi:hypothetical protein
MPWSLRLFVEKLKLQGTTGAPKGVVRAAGGHAVGLNFSVKYLFGKQEAVQYQVQIQTELTR